MALETYLHLKQRGCFERYRPEVWVGQVVGPAPFSDWSVLALVIKHGRKMVIMHDTGRLNYRSGPAIKEDICRGNYRIRISPPPNHREPSLLDFLTVSRRWRPKVESRIQAESWKLGKVRWLWQAVCHTRRQAGKLHNPSHWLWKSLETKSSKIFYGPALPGQVPQLNWWDLSNYKW